MPTAIELGRQIDEKRQELIAFTQERKGEHGLELKGDDYDAIQQRSDEINRLAKEYDRALKAEKIVADNENALKAERQTAPHGLFSVQGGRGGMMFREQQPSDLGAAFVNSEEYKAMVGSHSREAKYAVELHDSSLKAITTTDTLPYPMQQPGVVGYATRRPVVADLILQTDTDQPSIIYLEQTLQSFAAATVAEGGTKPESDFGWTRRTVPFEVIAHFAKISNQSLEDSPAIRDILNQEMVVGLQLAEETQILTGDGSTPNLQGFLTKTGVQTQAKGSDDIFTAFLKALTKVRYTGRANPDGAIFHPNDWQTLVTYQDSTGRFVFGDPSALMQSQTVWGVRSIVTDAMTENTALVGAFQTYSRLWRKGGIRVIVDTTGDDLIKNLKTVLVEERVALQISRAAAFCKLTGI